MYSESMLGGLISPLAAPYNRMDSLAGQNSPSGLISNIVHDHTQLNFLSVARFSLADVIGVHTIVWIGLYGLLLHFLLEP
jgi:hypothetical protein